MSDVRSSNNAEAAIAVFSQFFFTITQGVGQKEKEEWDATYEFGILHLLGEQ